MRKQKKAWLAALLNLVPLIGIVVAPLLNLHPGVDMVARVSAAIQFPYLFSCTGALYVAFVLWGLGYLYLGRFGRFVVALGFPWFYAVVYFLFPKPSLPYYISGPVLPYLEQALAVLGVFNLLSGIDAWLLASRQGVHAQEKVPESMTGADKSHGK